MPSSPAHSGGTIWRATWSGTSSSYRHKECPPISLEELTGKFWGGKMLEYFCVYTMFIMTCFLSVPPGLWSEYDSAELLEGIKNAGKFKSVHNDLNDLSSESQYRGPSTIEENSWPQWPFFSVPGPWSEHDSTELLRLPAAVRSLPLLLWLLRVPQPGHDPPQRGRHWRPPPQQVLDVSFFVVVALIAWLITLIFCLIDFTVFWLIDLPYFCLLTDALLLNKFWTWVFMDLLWLPLN